MTTFDILSRKRRGERHTSGEIRRLIEGFVAGEVADYQMSAWLMAVCINGLEPDETLALTEAMVASGETIDLLGLPGPTVDKHSTGGVGDKTTLVIVPLLACAGLTVAKMSGRGLGLTGGTIDKLEAIPGFRTSLTREEFLDQAKRIGCALAGQTANLVPADKKIYALRDVTATVDCVPLIAASVMSKKLACGARTIILDIKVGRGAFVHDIESARTLAQTMIEIGRAAGRRTIAVITGMDEPLGRAVGNANEVAEAIATLHGSGPTDLTDLSLDLAAMLHSAATASPLDSSRATMSEILHSGAAIEKLRQWIRAQGGDAGVVDDSGMLPQPLARLEVICQSTGNVQSLDAESIAQAASLLGTGRLRLGDVIDPSAGVLLHKKTGDPVQAGEPLATLASNRENTLPAAAELANGAWTISSNAVRPSPTIIETLGF